MNGTRIAASVIATVVASAIFEAWIKPRIHNGGNGNGGSESSDPGAPTHWPG